jgi:hypothetical protein
MDIDDVKSFVEDPLQEYEHDLLTAEYEALLTDGTAWERRKFVDYMSELLAADGPRLQSGNPEYYDDYQNYWLITALNVITYFPPEDREAIVARSIFAAVKRGFDPDDLLEQYYVEYASERFVAEQFASLLKGLKANQEPLGSAPIEIEGRKYLPQLRYWILDYTRFPSKVAQRGSLERLNYVNTSTNARQLTQVQRQYLMQVLKFYDDLNNPKAPRGKVEATVYDVEEELIPDTLAEQSEDISAEAEEPQEQLPAAVSEKPPVTVQTPPAPVPAALVRSTPAQEPSVPLSEIVQREKEIMTARHDALIEQKLEDLRKKVSK